MTSPTPARSIRPAGKSVLILSWILALGLGLMIGRRSSAEPPQASRQASPPALHSHPPLPAEHSPPAQTGTPLKKAPPQRVGTPEERIEQRMMTLANILNTHKQIERTRQMLSFTDQIADDEMAGVISAFQEAGWVDFNRSEFSMLIASWVDRDPFTAITFLDENIADGWTRKLAISAWASEHPSAAANAILKLKDDGKVNDWIVGLVQGMARKDPENALHTLSSLPNNHTKSQAIRSILPEVVLRGSHFASQWLENIKDPKLQRDTAKRLAPPLAQRDPQAASQWVSNISSPATRREASHIVSEIYAEQDLHAAIAWTETLPPDTLAPAAEGVTKHLTREDPARAAQWLLKLGDTPDLDRARIHFLNEAAARDPQIALENIPTLSSADQQERHYQRILSAWKKRDATAATAWASDHSASLPQNVLSAILPKRKK